MSKVSLSLILLFVVVGFSLPAFGVEAVQIVNEICVAQTDVSKNVTDWEVSGYYDQIGQSAKGLFDIAFGPELVSGATKEWKKMPVGLDPKAPGFMDLGKALGAGDNRVAYLRTSVSSENSHPVVLLMGSDDGIKVWLNGTQVYANNAVRGYSPDSDRAMVTLNEGKNDLMIKVTQENQGWGASLRIKELVSDLEEIPEKDVLRFEKSRIGDVTYEAASVFDVNLDGKLDIVSGGAWFPGPDFKEKVKICDVQTAGEYFDDFSDYPMDVNGDGYLDIITGGFWGCILRWRENPKGQPVEWITHDIDPCGNIETTKFWDVDRDGQVEAVPNAAGNFIAYKLVLDSAGKGTGVFKKHIIKEGGCGHGLGFGDVNADGRGDFIAPAGWLEAPEDAFNAQWTWHPEFNLGSASVPILAHDVNEDGLPDLIVGEAHNYGLYWMEQKKAADGSRSWEKHDIDPFRSQYHDMDLIDIDKDGRLELITGKRYRAHNDHDPGSFDPVGVYYYKIEKGKFRRATVDYGSAKENYSGVGIYFWVTDIDKNGWKDIVAPGKEGLYLFKNMGPR